MRSTTHQRLFTFFVIMLSIALFNVSALAQSGDTPKTISRSQSVSTITLKPHLVPVPGLEAVFTITETSFMGLSDRSGLFTLAPVQSSEESSRAVRVRYIVLDPDEDGRTVVMVQARAIDPKTQQSIGHTVWEAFYLIEPGKATFDYGSRVPGDYRDLVAPDWLADWSVTSTNQLPKRPLSPGDVWEAIPDDFIAFTDDFPVDDMDMYLTGEFVAWQDVTGASSRAAHIRETMEGGSETLAPLSDEIDGLVLYEMSATSDYHLIPGDFPYQSRQELTGGMVISVGEDSGAPEGVSGHIGYGFHFTRTIERDQSGSLDWLIVSESDDVDETLRRGDAVVAFLGDDGSFDFDDGTFGDMYLLVGDAGETVTIVLESDDFDAYLFVISDDDELIAVDDDSAGGTNAEVTFTFEYTGDYYVFVSSVFEGEAGTYLLTVE